jgi:hypothetical protein
MRNFSYKIEHDLGLAPNPFGGYCTLAVCRGDIRRNRFCQVGSWIFGTGSVSLECEHKLIYAMQVSEKLKFQDYWEDPRFQYKKPIVTEDAGLHQLYGDNFYHINPNDTESWIQERSAHSNKDGGQNVEHTRKDTEGIYVLIATNFYYFGNKAINVPHNIFHDICCTNGPGRYVRSKNLPKSAVDELLYYLANNYRPGIHGDPISWTKLYGGI